MIVVCYDDIFSYQTENLLVWECGKVKLQIYFADFKICTKSEYQCPSGKCINADYVCDGIPDCSSADDEASCKVSTSSE